jgi:RNA polymerase-binding protein DksA
VKEPKVTKAQLAAIAKAEAAAAAALAGPPVQVINPIGSVGLPSVRKAVPGKKAAPKHPVVQEDESSWSKTELNAVRKTLTAEAQELATEIAQAEEKFHALIMESGEGAGDDQADAGTKTFEREHEISILSNKKDLLDQTNRALERIEAGTYGACENCGKQIGKLRLQEANPRATMCMPCRQREDRS